MCGGTAYTPLALIAALGLSPRVRGNPLPEVAMTSGMGSIPACAGEPRTAASSGAGRRVYPRVCGGTSWR